MTDEHPPDLQRGRTPRRTAPADDGLREGDRMERRAIDRDRGEPLAVGERLTARARAIRDPKPLAAWTTRPRILVTNDDGVESRGLLALKQALESLGDVYVVAPETNQSAVGHQKTFMRPLRVRERTLADGSRAWSVDGSPTDAVSLAFLGYFDVVFDLVASGINYGANLGDDVTYSGTVSAAMEAVINECPALAVSQEYYAHPDFTLAGRVAHLVAVNILERGLSPGELLNVNVPARIAPGPDGGPVIDVTRMGKRIYQDQLIERLDPRGVPYYWIGGPAPSGHSQRGTDFHSVVNGRIAVTPIQLDLTASRQLRRLRSWELRLPPSSQDVAASDVTDTLDRP